MSKEAVDKGHQAWLAAMEANNPSALGRLVTDDAVLMPPHQDSVVRPQGVIEWFTGVVKQARTVGVRIVDREVIMAGDLAIERGSFVWKVAPTDGTSPIEDRGGFLSVWERQSGDAWKVKRLIWNSTLPVAAVT